MFHWWFLYRIDAKRLAAAIAEAESRTSGEICIYVSHRKHGDPLKAAKVRFERLGMTNTAQRNGILFYIVPRCRTFAILGDEGIHAKVGHAFWEELAALLTASFKEGHLTEGLEKSIRRAGDLLAEFFPPLSGDKNELPDHPTGGL
ncbi:MAG: TPM domain-containing protein [Prosthecobacter sp.]|nr:TPM domain-containing protein [Prosthecobacter sp.]